MISFVILHYKNVDDTLECIKSIIKLKKQNNISIIIVDNHTLSKNEENKIREYTDNIILLKENLGFAKANNIGCKYAIEKYHPDYIAVINNDTLILEKDFSKKLQQLYDKYRFDVFGPYIKSPGDSVNPFYTYDSLSIINKEIRNCKIGIFIYSHKIIHNIYKNIIKIKHKIIKKKKRMFQNGKEDQLNVSLHGCFLVFSKKYYKRFENVFYNETFLYHEEEFLSDRRDKYNLIYLYSPKIKIYHKEGQSSKMIDSRERKLFIYKNRKESLEKLKILKIGRKENEKN